jgi:hypothetical protein
MFFTAILLASTLLGDVLFWALVLALVVMFRR